MKTKAILTAALLFLIALPATSYALVGFHLEAGIGAWMQGDPEGTISNKGGDLDLVDDFGFEGATRLIGRLKIEHPVFILPNVYIAATPMSFEGSKTRTQTFTFGDFTFDSDATFDTKLNMTHYDLALFYGIPFLETATMGKLDIEVGLNARIMQFSAEVKGEVFGFTETSKTDDMLLPIPMVYVGVNINPIDLIGIEGELRGVAYGDNHFYSGIGRVLVKPFGPLYAALGYRYDDIAIDTDEVKASLKFTGPFAEAGVTF